MLDKNYNPKEIEKKWQKYWEKHKIYKFNPNSKKPVYSIDVPPPYASAGHLHVGHALHYTQFEIIARFRRMNGFNVYFAPCFDNNGLPTEKYVEEKLKISKNTVSRAEFRKICLSESRKVEKTYADRVFKTLGHSYDWELLYTTIDPEAQKVAQMSFLDLTEKGDCYRAKEPTIWCTHHQTALAQAEVQDLQRTTKLNEIDFDLEYGKKIAVATTRPEFLPACVGIFVHPQDKRYKNLVGKKAVVPLFKHKVSIMKDEKVDKEFGTGIVMICTFGDTTDIEWWKKHKLPLRICITEQGKMINSGNYDGLSITEAREKILEDLEEQGRLKSQTELQQTVGSCWRCSTPIEFIITPQWFIKTLKYKKELIQQAKKINWYPGYYQVRYNDWVKNLAWDWCISRQRFFGVPMPVWYCKKCNEPIFADKKDLPIDPTIQKPKKKCKCGSSEFVPETDVFDTWMTSSMTPQIIAKWLEKPNQYQKMFPLSLRPQSHDIIRTWAFYTILKSYLHFKQIPWKDIAIGTFVLDSKGRGMHKSKGNAIWTEDLLEKFNVDVIRYWVGTATFGEDLPFQEKDLVTGNKFLTKLWNASKFVLMHLENYKLEKPKKLQSIDSWFLAKLSQLTKESTDLMMQYKIGDSTRLIENFFWHTFCDNYLEFIKDRIYNPDKRGKDAKISAQYTLYQSLQVILKLLAPITPHITEEIYQSYYSKKEKIKSIHISEWPKPITLDKTAEKAGDRFVEIVREARKFKAEKKVSLKTRINLTLDKKDESLLKQMLEDLKATLNADISFNKFKIELA